MPRRQHDTLMCRREVLDVGSRLCFCLFCGHATSYHARENRASPVSHRPNNCSKSEATPSSTNSCRNPLQLECDKLMSSINVPMFRKISSRWHSQLAREFSPQLPLTPPPEYMPHHREMTPYSSRSSSAKIDGKLPAVPKSVVSAGGLVECSSPAGGTFQSEANFRAPLVNRERRARECWAFSHARLRTRRNSKGL